MKVLFVTDGISTPASRFRCAQFFPYFRKMGIECELRYAYGEHYNDAISRFYGGPYKFACRLRRSWYQLFPSDGTDILFLQRTAFPFTGAVEQIGSENGLPTVFDFDDSLFVDGDGKENPLRRKAFYAAVESSDYLIPGNQFLNSEAGNRPNSQVIPTVIDTDLYIPRSFKHYHNKVILGWMGTAGNFPFLSSIVDELRRLLVKYPDLIVRIVSNQPFEPLLGVERVQQIRWTAETELSWLQSFDIGLMPLIDSPLTRGKCAFKMIQYMSLGIPVVVSPVGANVEVFSEAPPIGYMPNEGLWFEAISHLIEEPLVRREMGSAGRARAEELFSIRAVLPAYASIFERLL